MSCNVIVNSRYDLQTYPWTSSGFLRKKSFLPFIGKRLIYCCSFQCITCVSKPFYLTSIKSKDRNRLLSIDNEMCVYVKFDLKLSICVAKDRHMCHIREAFSLYQIAPKVTFPLYIYWYTGHFS